MASWWGRRGVGVVVGDDDDGLMIIGLSESFIFLESMACILLGAFSFDSWEP